MRTRLLVALATVAGVLLGTTGLAWAAAPGAPQSPTAQPKDGAAVVSWQAPSSNGGSTITGYRVESTPGSVVVTVNGSTFSTTVSGLTNGTSYTFVVKAINADGTGPASAATAPVTPAQAPSVPRSVSASAGNAQATVSWTAPSSNGGSAITGYRVTTSPGNGTTTVGAAATSATITGLTNGTAYTFTVLAFNAAAEGPASSPTTPITPSAPPGAPTAVSATSGNGQATVSWTAPSSDGGSAVTGYTVTSAPGGRTATTNGAGRSATVTGLTNGTTYTFTVTATNVRGTGPASVASPAIVVGLPGAPTNVTGVAGDTQVTVSWSAPSSDGGSSITGYRITASPGGRTATTGPSNRSVAITGLTNGTGYTFTVSASNSRGSGPLSAPSATVVPGVPGPPTNVRATAGNAQATVTWTAPSSTGGSAITSYTVTASPGGATISVGSVARSATLTGLSNGTSYTFTVRAVNGRGTGPASTPSPAVTPFAREVRRIAGADRIATAVAASQDAWATTSTSASATRALAQAVVLARANDFADALAGTPLAARKVGPLLLTSSGQLDGPVRSEIGRVLARGAIVYLLGGTGALSSSIESMLVGDGYRTVRLAGADRYDTAVRIADVGLGNPTTQVVVTGLGFADALSAGAAAARLGASVLLTAGDQLPGATGAYLRDHGGSRFAVGGQAARALPSAESIAGADRYDTAVRVARRFFSGPVEIGVASGTQFPDALAGSAHIGARRGPLLLVSSTAPRVVTQYLSEQRGGSLIVDVYGGTAAVSNTVRDQLAAAIR